MVISANLTKIVNNLLSPATKEIGELIAKPFALLNGITNVKNIKHIKESFIYICEKLNKKKYKRITIY